MPPEWAKWSTEKLQENIQLLEKRFQDPPTAILVLLMRKDLAQRGVEMPPLKKHKVMVEIEVTDENLRAGNYKFSPHEPERLMGLEEMVRFHLQPALQARVQILNDGMRWREGKFWEHPMLRQEMGRTHKYVIDRDTGEKHSIMVNSGVMYPIRVEQPREGPRQYGR